MGTDDMTRLLFDHFWEKCLQRPKVGECVDFEGSNIKVRYCSFYLRIKDTDCLTSSGERSRISFPWTTPALLTITVGWPIYEHGSWLWKTQEDGSLPPQWPAWKLPRPLPILTHHICNKWCYLKLNWQRWWWWVHHWTRTVLGDDRIYVENDNCNIAYRQCVCE